MGVGIEHSSDGWVEESEYEVQGDIGGGKLGPQRGRTAENPLLDAHALYFWGPFKEPPLKELTLLATLAGATIVDRLRSSADNVTVIYEGNKKDESEIEAFQDKHPHVDQIVSHKWLLDSAGSFEKQPFNDYL